MWSGNVLGDLGVQWS